MAPSNRATQSSLAKGVAAWTYVQRPDKSPLRPLIPILRTRWVNDLYKWIGKQDERFPELIAYGFYSVKGDMVFSTLEQATDYHNGYLTVPCKPAEPAAMVYVRSKDTDSLIALNKNHVDLTRDDLSKLRYQVSQFLVTGLV